MEGEEMMEVRKDGERIKISFPYNPDYITRIKTIEGYRWHPEGRYWSVPYSEFEKLLSVFDGKKLVIDSTIHLDELKKELMLRKYSQRTIKRPKKDRTLPVVLSQEEVFQILSAVSNLKHKAILMLIYSAGLRVSEVVKLKPENIDAERKLIHIKGAKGRKDRYTLLSDIALDMLNEYIQKYIPM
jgi:hypothetical protein